MASAPPDPPALHDRALQDLSFIRRTMEGAAAFTDVPGWGLVAVGGVGCGSAYIAAQQPTPERWLLTWIVAAVVGVVVGGAAMLRKMRRRMSPERALMLSTPARKFLLSFWPAIFAGALLTLALVDPSTPGIDARITARVLPGLWLLLYGLGVTTAGAFSIRIVPLMGLGFMSLSAIALLLPAANGDLLLGLGFGVLQILFGTLIARRHGG